MKIKKLNLNKNSKIILSSLVVGSLLIGICGFYVVNDIQMKMDKSYSQFAQLMTKAIALQTTGLENVDNPEKSRILAGRLLPFFNKNDDVSYIEYKDSKNNLIYSSKSDYPVLDDDLTVSVSSPVFSNNKIIGAVTVGMNAKKSKLFAMNAKKSMVGIFVLTWSVFTLILFLSFILMSKELEKLHKGVRQIAIGQFGYKLESENMGELTQAFNDMSSLLSMYEEQNIEQLTLERNKLEAVLMSIINGVVVCDNFDKVVLSNSSALSMLEVEEKDFINTKIQDFIDCHGQKCFLDKIEEFKDTPLNIIEQKPIEFNIEAGKKTIKAMISPMFSKQQDYVGYIIVLLDITREMEVNKLKNTFISNVSHELRTPVTVLRTYIDTLCNNGDDFDEETKKEFMQTIDTEAKRLHSMVNDILDFSRLESGNVHLRKEYSDLSELLQQNINSIKILADEKNIKISYEREEKLPSVPINVESIDRVIRNLLSNAIKYSPDGKDIFVTAGLTEDKQNFYFSVRDTGIGMAKEHLEKIFDRFYRVENATHTVKGTGLGLHLVKMTIEKHHAGKITVTSKENEGSTFTVTLPLTVDEGELA
ncbi:MAG: PAS domain-containing protein [Cyanobacteria bacterium SIG29]|nr:PAS domain-containing protein [Cyanobacteria bacterium SIG29]